MYKDKYNKWWEIEEGRIAPEDATVAHPVTVAGKHELWGFLGSGDLAGYSVLWLVAGEARRVNGSDALHTLSQWSGRDRSRGRSSRRRGGSSSSSRRWPAVCILRWKWEMVTFTCVRRALQLWSAIMYRTDEGRRVNSTTGLSVRAGYWDMRLHRGVMGVRGVITLSRNRAAFSTVRGKSWNLRSR